MTKRRRGKGEVDYGVGVLSGVITCRPPMRCARRRTPINYDRTTPAPKDEKVAPALSTSEEPPATQIKFHKLALLLRAYEPPTSRSSTRLSQMDFFLV